MDEGFVCCCDANNTGTIENEFDCFCGNELYIIKSIGDGLSVKIERATSRSSIVRLIDDDNNRSIENYKCVNKLIDTVIEHFNSCSYVSGYTLFEGNVVGTGVSSTKVKQ